MDIEKYAKENVVKVLVGNKCDLEHKRLVSFEQGKDLGKIICLIKAEKYGIKFIETSAKDTVNIDELFITSTKILLDRIIASDVKGNKKSVGGTSTVNIDTNVNTTGQVNNGGCC